MNIKIVNISGTEGDIVNVSRITTANEDKELGGEQVERALKHLIKNGHWSPFEFIDIVLEIECPIYLARQWFRHKGTPMELSRRYVKDDIENEDFSDAIAQVSYAMYKQKLEFGEKPEQARKVLPMSTMTHFLWKANLRDLLFTLNLRTAPEAQQEMQLLAFQTEDLLREQFPTVFRYYDEYILGGEKLLNVKSLKSLIPFFDELEKTSDGKELVKYAKTRMERNETRANRCVQEIFNSSESGKAL